MATSLEKILAKHDMPKYRFIQAMGKHFKDNEYNTWYERFAGKRKLTHADAYLISKTLKELGFEEKVEFGVDKYVII